MINKKVWLISKVAFDNDKIPFAYVEEIHPYPVTLLLHWCWITEKFYVLGLPEDAVDILEKREFIEYEGEMGNNIIPTFETYDQALNFIMKYLQQK